jgi:IclR family transcriptional regulator, KDG regulon repressor
MKQCFKLDTIDRVTTIVSYLASSNSSKRLTEIAKQLGLSKTSTYRILHSLEKSQWVACESDTKMYRIGYKILELGLAILSNTTVKIISLRYLNDLRNLTGETVGLSIRIGNESMFIEEMQSTRELRYITPMGKRIPLWYGSIGKAILSNMQEDERAKLLDELLQSGTPHLPSGKALDLDELLAELDEVRKQGYAVSIEEREPGASAVAAPIFNRHNEVVGAINVVGPSERINKDTLKKYGILARESAEKITREMGASNLLGKIN